MPCGARPRKGREGPYHPRWRKVNRNEHFSGRKSRVVLRLSGSSGTEETRQSRTSSESSDGTPEKVVLEVPWVGHGRRPHNQVEGHAEDGLAAAAGRMLDPGCKAKRPPKLLEHALAQLQPSQTVGLEALQSKAAAELAPSAPETSGPSQLERLVARPGDELLSGLNAVYKSVATVVTTPAAQKASCFQAVREPPMPVLSYLARLRTYCQCSDACFVASLVLIDRAARFRPGLEVSNLTIHRLLAASIVIGAKFLDDVYYSNAYYAKVCGLSVRELNSLEAALLRLVDWNVAISHADFERFAGIILGKMPEEPGSMAARAA